MRSLLVLLFVLSSGAFAESSIEKKPQLHKCPKETKCHSVAVEEKENCTIVQYHKVSVQFWYKNQPTWTHTNTLDAKECKNLALKKLGETVEGKTKVRKVKFKYNDGKESLKGTFRN